MKKKMILISVIVLVVIAIVFGIRKFYGSYMFSEDGTISGTGEDAYKLFFEQVEKVSGDDKTNLINFGVEHNIITEAEGEKLLKGE